MLRGLVALLRIAKEVRRIRKILEIVFSKELSLYELTSSSLYKSLPFKEVDIPFKPKRDIFGETLEDREGSGEIIIDSDGKEKIL